VANALYGRKDDEVAIVAEAPGAPPMDDEPVEVHIDPDDPAASTAIVRSWLVDDDDDESPGAPTDGRPGTGRPGPAGPVTNR
jgi:hypothetical protein